MQYPFFLCDVFTRVRFAGNPLAVIPRAEGLAESPMQAIAREFNFSETSFVFPALAGHTRSVRIFTPFEEVPFAGHPNIGTAFVLAAAGELGELSASMSVVFEEQAGLVPIDIEVQDGQPVQCELGAPELLAVGEPIPVEAVADALSLSPGDVATDTHLPREASVGLPFLFVELRSLDALSRMRIDPAGLEALEECGAPRVIHAYVRTRGETDLRARVMIASGGYEDPATGSANCALVAMLAELSSAPDCELSYRIAQGIEMGRPSTLLARAEKRDGRVVAARIGGSCVLVGTGTLEVD